MITLRFLLRVVRLPLDLVFLTLDSVRLAVWLVRRWVRRMLGKRRKTWGPFCDSPRTVSSGAQACPVAWKYANMPVLKLLCPDCRTTSAGERFCGVVEDDRQHRREIPVSRLVALGGVLTMFWVAVAVIVVEQVAREPSGRKPGQPAARQLVPPVGVGSASPVTKAPREAPPRQADVATVLRPDKPIWKPARPEPVPRPREAKREPPAPKPKPKAKPKPKPKHEPAPVPVETPEQARARAQELVAEGDRHFSERRYVEALIAYSGAVRRDRTNVRAHLGVGRCHLRQETRPSDTRAAFEEVIRLDPSLVEAQVALCRLAFAEGDHERATKHALAARRLEPGDPELFMLVSACREAQGDLEGASQEVATALGLDDVTGATCLAAGGFYLRHRDLAKAESAYRQAIGLGGDDKIARVGLARVLRGRGKLDPALQELAAVLRQSPGYPDAMGEMAEVLTAQGDVEAAAATYEELVRQDPERHDSRAQLSQMLLRLGRIDDAVTAAQQVLKVEPGNATSSLVLAEAFLAGGLYSMARDHCERALRSNPGSVQARMLLARCHSAKKRHDLVVRELTGLLAVDTQHLEARLLLGRTYLGLGQLDKARACFQTAAREHPESPEPPLALGDVEIRRGFPEVAMLCYEDAKRLGPDNPVAISRFALALLDHGGDMDRAHRLVQELKARFPTEPIAWGTYGWACYRRGEYGEAVKSLSIAARELPGDATVRYQYGAALHKAGEAGRAAAELEAAIEMSDQFLGVSEAKKMLAEIKGKANDE